MSLKKILRPLYFSLKVSKNGDSNGLIEMIKSRF
jgi:hypothetical protein